MCCVFMCKKGIFLLVGMALQTFLSVERLLASRTAMATLLHWRRPHYWKRMGATQSQLKLPP